MRPDRRAKPAQFSDKPRGKGKPQGKKGGARGDKRQGQGRDKGAQQFQARPPKPEKKIDPDNPFAAALMGLKDNS
jgi:ATP-dependent RNA helicase SUPV3L1/SUV3